LNFLLTPHKFKNKILIIIVYSHRLQVIDDEHQWLFQEEDTYKIKLMDKFQAEATFCPGGKDCSEQKILGTWSTIYDQAFKVELATGIRFLANFKYAVKPTISKEPTTDGAEEFVSLKTGDYNKFNSHCDKTMVGFVQGIPKVTGV
jgi:hypothetical protein